MKSRVKTDFASEFITAPMKRETLGASKIQIQIDSEVAVPSKFNCKLYVIYEFTTIKVIDVRKLFYCKGLYIIKAKFHT